MNTSILVGKRSTSGNGRAEASLKQQMEDARRRHPHRKTGNTWTVQLEKWSEAMSCKRIATAVAEEMQPIRNTAAADGRTLAAHKTEAELQEEENLLLRAESRRRRFRKPRPQLIPMPADHEDRWRWFRG